MVKKGQQATKSATPTKARKQAKPRGSVADVERELLLLKKERNSLRTELAAAKKRIGELEALNEEAVNRIDWVVDSLHSLLED